MLAFSGKQIVVRDLLAKHGSNNSRWRTTLLSTWYDTFVTAIEATLTRICVGLEFALDF